MTVAVSGDSITFPDNSVQATAPKVGMVNRIINGAMVIDQRNAGASVTVGSGYAADRFLCEEDSDGAATVQQVSDAPSGFVNSLKWTTTTADASLSGSQYAIIRQHIEGYNVADFAFGTANAVTITLSFWVKSSLTGTFGASFRNNPATRSYPFTYTVSTANTWEQKSVTISGETTGTWLKTNGRGLTIDFGLGVGSTFSGTAGAWATGNFISATGTVSVIGTLNATWQITGVQLEKGSTATSFDYRPYGTELGLCQRYFQIVRNGNMLGNSTTGVIVSSMLSPTMRATPSLSQQGVVEVGAGDSDRTQSSVNTFFLNGADNTAVYLLGNYTGIVVRAGYQFRLSANTNGVTASAEL